MALMLEEFRTAGTAKNRINFEFNRVRPAKSPSDPGEV
jgi:hypothetical protein